MDMDHAHGPSNNSLSLHEGRGQHGARQRPFPLPHTPSPVPSRTDSSLSNQRRLQLRNDRFRASRLSVHKISAGFSRIFHPHEEPQSAPVTRDRENKRPSYRSLRGARSNDTLNSPLGILHEISSSTRSRQAVKRSTVPVFEDEPERPLLEASPATPASEYHEVSSSPLSPAIYAFAHLESGSMRLREVSGNERRSPSGLSSPLTRSVKSKQMRNLNLRKATFDASLYIDGLEKELTTVKSKQLSPNTGKPYVEKLRGLEAEYKLLERAYHDLEQHFEDRIKAAMEHKTAMEGVLRRKIRELEEVVEQKDLAIQELEYVHEESRLDQNVIESLKATIEKLEIEKQSLEDSNRSMGRRNDVLTELLAMSPTKNSFELASPIRDGLRKAPRPRSMMIPRLPTSPSLGHSSRPQSLMGSPALSASYFNPQPALLENSTDCLSPRDDADSHTRTDDAQSIDSDLGQSCSVRSRRSTLASQDSVSPSAWGFSFPISPSDDKGTVRQTQKRKARRFMSGSTQLKPLLLPAIAAEGGSAQNSSVLPHPLTPGRRDTSEGSMDPTTSFLSRAFDQPAQHEYQPAWFTTEPESKVDEGFEDNMQPLEDTDEKNLLHAVHCAGPPSPASTSRTVLGLPPEPDSPSLLDDMALEEEVTAFIDSDYSNKLNESEHPLLSFDNVYHSNAVGKCEGRNEGHDALKTLDLEMPAADLSAMKASPHMYTPVSQDIGASSKVSDSGFSPDIDETTSPEQSDPEGSKLFISLLNSIRNTPAPNPKKRRKSSSPPDNDYFIFPSLQQQPGALSPSPCSIRQKLTPTSLINRVPLVDLSPPIQCLESQLPARTKSIARSRSPLEMLQQRNVNYRPLASVTIQTIYGTLSRYTTYIREMKRDPMALARRVIANAWRSNWKRLGKLSWWVLGLFLGPGARSEFRQQIQGFASNWDDYDGESIAERVQAESRGANLPHANETPRGSARSRKVRFDEQNEGYRTSGNRSPARPALKSGKSRNSSWGKSLLLWGKFSVAILLAVGGAVVRGPAEMMKDCDEQTKPRPGSRSQSTESPQRSDPQSSPKSCISVRTKPFDFSMDSESDPEIDGDDDGDQRYEDIGHPNHDRTPCPREPRVLTQQDRYATPASAPITKSFTFGSPCHNQGWDQFNDSGGARPSRARSEEFKNRPDHSIFGENGGLKLCNPESPSIGRYVDDGRENLGALSWMQTLGMTDFTDFGNADVEGTVRSKVEKKQDQEEEEEEEEEEDGG